jgi:glyoxylase-like metal-dependent hydrolase (beta-lactamase superfamily II)
VDLIIAMASGGIASTNCYLIGDEPTKKAVIFDAPDHTVTPLLDEAEKRGLDVIGLWLTHGHFDHVAEHALVTQRFPNAKVLIHKLDEPKLQDPTDTMFALPFTIPPRSADSYLEDGQTLSIGELTAKVIHTPGHSPGHVVFHFEKENLLVGGDLIICGAVGRTDLPDSDEAELFRSIRKVMELPPETQLLPGHCDPSTLGEERATNPYAQEALRS